MPHRLPILALAVLAASESAAVQIDEQGRLQPPVDGQYDLVFSLYKSPFANAKLWSESWPKTSVLGGVFQVRLGVKSDIPPALLAAQSEVWLGVRVAGEPELPRQRLVTIPRAVHAVRALTAAKFAGPLAAFDCSGCIGEADLQAAGVTAVKIAAGAVSSDKVSFNWAAAQVAGGAALKSDDVQCLACIEKEAIGFGVATSADLTTTGTLLSSLACTPGQRPVLTQASPGKTAWVCASATPALGRPMVDPWGWTWDGVPRAAKAWVDAASECTGVGARLPTATELWRNNATSGTGALAMTNDASALWTLVANGGNRTSVRLSDGLVQFWSPGTLLPFRCVWPDVSTVDFTGDLCNGPPGASCFSVDGGRANIDARDRVPLPISAAISECSLTNARLPELEELERAVRAGLPNGSGKPGITTGEPYETCWDLGASKCYYHGAPFLLLAWKGTAPTWLPTLGAPVDNGFGGQWHFNANAFRCRGVVNRKTLVASKKGGAEDAALAMRVDTSDAQPAVFFSAVDFCYQSGGHLLSELDLWSLIRNGVGTGSGTNVWTSSQTDLRPLTLGWTTPGDPFWPAQAYQAGHLNEAAFSSSAPYRCGYFPTSTAVVQPQCQGGCFTVQKGDVKVYVDGLDRPATYYYEAVDMCASLGGRLPSARDMAELIRDGLPNGSTKSIWTTSTMVDELISFQASKLVVHWEGTNTAWFPGDTLDDPKDGYGKRLPLYEEAFRCLWTNEVH